MAGAQHPAVQRLQFFLSESRRDPERVNDRRLELLLADPATAPHGGGVLVIDDSGDRKDGTKTAHVGRQWPGRYGKTDNGVVTVTTVWADERVYYPVHALPYTPARHFAKGKNDPVVPRLAAAYRVIRVDLLGHGRSASPADGYDIPAHARRVGAVLDMLGVSRVTVIGHSSGCTVATALAEQRPDAVAGLALIDMGARPDPVG